jgi:predicted transcriptional regulator
VADRTVSMTLKLTTEEHEALKARAEELDRSMAWVIRHAVRKEIGLDPTPGARTGPYRPKRDNQ